MQSIVGCWVGRLTVGKGVCVCGVYCVGEGKREEKGEVKLMGGRVVVLQGGSG